MINNLDQFYLDQQEPTKSCFLTLKSIILSHDPEITTAWKYKLPFFCFRGKMFCYLWKDKKTNFPYIGFVEGQKLHFPELVQENRKRMKILPINPNQDIPITIISNILETAIGLYKNGIIKTKN